MADLMVMPRSKGPDPAYQDQDVVVPLQDCAIHCKHAETICLPRDAQDQYPRDGDGLIVDPLGLAEDFCRESAVYAFARVSRDEVIRTRRSDGHEDILGLTPVQGKFGPEVIHVEAYVSRALGRAKAGLTALPMFGTPGRERWYGKSETRDNAQASRIWTHIETKTPQRKADHGLWPASAYERRRWVWLRTDDFPDQTRREMVAHSLADAVVGSCVIEGVGAPSTAPIDGHPLEQLWIWEVRLDQTPLGVRTGDRLRIRPSLYRVLSVRGRRDLTVASRRPLPPPLGTADLIGTRGRRRARRVPWRDLPLSHPVADLEDDTKDTDERPGRQHQVAAIVELKP